jgi:hypothetical protein
MRMLLTAVSNEDYTLTIVYTLWNDTHHNRKLPSAATAANTDIEQLTATTNTTVENVWKTSMQQKTAKPKTDKREPKCSNCGGKHENWRHECPTRITESCVGLTACGGNYHLILPLKTTLGFGS